MNEHTRVVTGAVLGALAGGLVAFFVFGARGEDTLRQMSTSLDGALRTLEEFRSVVRKVDGIVHEAQATVRDVQAVLSSGDALRDRKDSPQEV